jgi:hypothetical protein
MLPKQLANNPPKVEHSPTHMHSNAIKRFTNIAAFELIPKITLIWGLKVPDMCQPAINLDMAILI